MGVTTSSKVRSQFHDIHTTRSIATSHATAFDVHEALNCLTTGRQHGVTKAITLA